jgi:hypothetical protein
MVPALAALGKVCRRNISRRLGCCRALHGPVVSAATERHIKTRQHDQRHGCKYKNLDHWVEHL